MATYMRGIMGTPNGLRPVHLQSARSVPAPGLATLLVQWEFVRQQLDKKGFKEEFLADLEQIGIRSVENLVERMNRPVPHPDAKIPHGAPPEQRAGPMLLHHLIDEMWLLILDPVESWQIKSYMRMFDPDSDEGTTHSMLSHRPHGFRDLGICFRGDTRSFAEFGPGGFTARFAVPPGQPYHVAAVHGTVAAQGMAFDRQARDFANQTGVCVARNIVGAMKFVGARDDDDRVLRTGGWVHAVKFHEGVDTEQMQLDEVLRKGASRTTIWRAGEKAARQIPKWRFIASCRFEVNAPYSTRSNPTFRYRRTSDWTFHWSGVSALRDYVLLSTRQMPLQQWCDFTARDDWANAA